LAERVAFPEQCFLRDVFANEVSEESLATVLATESMRRHLRRRIDEALNGLSYRERGILQMHYGLGDGHVYSLAEVGFVFKLTPQRVRQLEARAIGAFRMRTDDLRKLLCQLEN
jgi:RNA polymerase primary sigma factor